MKERKRGKLRRWVTFSLKPKNFWAAGAFLLGALLLCLVASYLFIEDPPQGRVPLFMGRVWKVFLLVLFSEFFMFLRIRLSGRTRRAFSYVFLFIAPFLAFLTVDLINETNFPKWFQLATLRPRKVLGNYLCYLFLFLLLYGLFRSVFFACLTGEAAFFLFGAANYFTVAFRGNPILPWDLTAVGTAADVIRGYELRMTFRMLFLLLLLMTFLCLVFSVCGARPLPAGRRWRWGERGVSVLSSGLLLFLLLPCNLLSHMTITVYPWRQASGMRVSGVMGGFFANCNYLIVDKPETYSSQRLEELEKGSLALPGAEMLGYPSEAPDIIVIMNESLADFTRIGDLTYSEDPLPVLHRLEASGEVIWGNAYASIYGGGTCNSEYEFLTGNTTAFLPVGARPYQQYVTSLQPSLARVLSQRGYETVAVHPGERNAWQRDRAYPNLGFERFIDGASFEVEQEYVRGFTTDRTNYDQVIYEYEHRDREKSLFLFNVTIANHGGYATPNYESTIKLTNAAGRYPTAEQYLSLLKDSDRDFGELIDYFSGESRPVVILMFGDHWPRLEDRFYTELLGENVENLSLESTQRMYEVPFVIWANYPLKGQQTQAIGLNYLSNYLSRAAGLELTGYQRFLERLRESVPVINALGFQGEDGVWYQTGEKSPYTKELLEYEVLQYNNIFDDRKRREAFFLGVDALEMTGGIDHAQGSSQAGQ